MLIIQEAISVQRSAFSFTCEKPRTERAWKMWKHKTIPPLSRFPFYVSRFNISKEVQ